MNLHRPIDLRHVQLIKNIRSTISHVTHVIISVKASLCFFFYVSYQRIKCIFQIMINDRLKIAKTRRTIAGARPETESMLFPKLAKAVLRPRTSDGIIPEMIKYAHGSSQVMLCFCGERDSFDRRRSR